MIPLNISKEHLAAWIEALQYAQDNDTDFATDSGLDSGDPINPPPPQLPPM